jgi:hypothetical protein
MTAPIMNPTVATTTVIVSGSFIANDQDLGLSIGIYTLQLVNW